MTAFAVAAPFVLAAAPASAAPRSADEAPYVKGRLIVDFTPGTPSFERRAARAAAGASRHEQLSPLTPNTELLTLATGRDVKAAVAALSRNPNVRFVEPDYIVSAVDTTIDPTAISNDPQFTNGSLWGMYGDASSPANTYGSGAAEVWATDQVGSSNVYVGVIDEGADYNHPDLAGNMWTNPGEVLNGLDDDGNGYVDDIRGWDFDAGDNSTYDGTADDHGTHVSGTIGGVGGNGIGVAGVNWDVTMINTKFLGANGGATSNAVRAVDYLTDLKTRLGINLVATSNSWGGGGFSQALADAINRGGDRGILFIAAAGNATNNNDASAFYPANNQCVTTAAGQPRGWDCLVSVAAIDSAGGRASFSNYGATTVDLGAPGVSVMSTLPGGTYGAYSGTSMATPHVSGAVALCASMNPAMTAFDLRAALLGSVAPTASLAGATSTGGRLDVGAMSSQCAVASAPVDGGPSSLVAVAASSMAIRLTWVDGATNEAYQEVQRAAMPLSGSCADVAGGSWTVASTVGANTTATTIGGLASSTAYCFRVRAGNSYDTGSGRSVSAWSNLASATTLDAPPPYVCGAVAYQWVDAAGSTAITMGDDSSVDVAMPFSIDYYGTTYSRVAVGSNGLVGFGNAVTAYSNVGIPSTGTPNGFVAPFWDDLNPGVGGTVATKTSGTAPNRTFTVMWLGVPHYSVTGSTLTFQLVIDEATGSFTMNYADVVTGNSAYDRGASASVGLESPDGVFGTQVGYLRTTLADGTSLRCARTATPSPTITTGSLPAALVQNSYAATLSVEGGTAPYTWALTSGTMPAGLTLLTGAGVIAGTPTATANATLGLRVTDAVGRTATVSLPLNVSVGIMITSGALPDAGQNVTYSTTLAATGGVEPYAWSLASGSTLPPGLSLNSSTGVLSGTPSSVGTFTFSVNAVDAAATPQTATRSLSLSVTTSPIITTTSLAAGMVNVSMSRTLVVSGGARSFTWSVSAGALPAGLSLSSAGVISGTPTTAGSSTFTVLVTDSVGRTDDQILSLTIDPLFVVSTSSLPNAAVNLSYSTTLQATGGSGTYTWSATGLPTGLVLDASTGVISGTPTSVGTSSVNVVARDTASRTSSRTLSLVVTAAPVVTTTSLTSTTTTASYSYTLVASGGALPLSWSVVSGSLPAGATLSTSGVLSGSAAPAGTYSFTVQVADSYGRTDDQSLSLLVVAPVAVTTSSLPAASQNVAYSTTLAASGGTGTYTWTATGLPAGLSLASATGVISGVPTVSGTFSVTVSAADDGTPVRTGTRTLSLSVGTPLLITTTSINSVTTGSVFSFTLAATGGSGTRTWTLASGTLPSGVTLSTGGVLSGTASTTGSWPITVRVTDTSTRTDDQDLTLVAVAPVSVTTAALPAGTTGAAYSASVAASGGTGTYRWSATGLPSGLSIDASTGVISGVPVVAATSSVSVTASDDGTPSRSATRTLSLAVAAPIVITTSSLADGVVGVAYSSTLAATGGSGTRTWSVTSGSLPSGVTLSTGGVLSGTPTSSGSFSVTVAVTDASARTDDQVLSLTVAVRSVRSSSISISRSVSTKGTTASVIVTVVDQSGAASPSTSVTGVWTVSGVTGSTTRTGTTGALGTVTLSSATYKGITGRTIQFCITGLVRSGYVYDNTGTTCATMTA